MFGRVLTTGDAILHPSQSQMGGWVERTWAQGSRIRIRTGFSIINSISISISISIETIFSFNTHNIVQC